MSPARAIGIGVVGTLAATAGLRLLLPKVLQLAAPDALGLLFALPVLALVWGLWWRWRARVEAALGTPATIARMREDWMPRREVLRFALFAGAVLLLVIALARPQWGERTREVQRAGIDIVFAVDVSRSMLANDVAPSRLDAARAEIDRVLRRRSGDRVGLVVFAGIAFTQTPLTADYGAIRLYLDRLRPDDLPVQGTAVGAAIDEATRLLTGHGNPDFRRASNQIVVVITDGEDHDSDPLAAAKRARDAGIWVHTVGIGTAEGSRIPIRAPDGTLREYLTDRNGNVVVSRLETEQLRAVARDGGGEAILWAGEGSVATPLETAIQRYGREQLSTALRRQYEDRFAFFAFPAFLLLLVSRFIPVRRAQPPVAHVLSALLLATALGGAGCAEVPLLEDPDVALALQLANDGRHDEALAALDNAHEAVRDNPAWWFNRARILDLAGRHEEATEAWLRVLAAGDSPHARDAALGLGNSLVKAGRYDEAIQRFRRMLVANPDDHEARRNLEIALRLLHPLCTDLDDAFEDNDTPETAVDLPADRFLGPWVPEGGTQAPAAPDDERPPHVVCPGDPDWFRIPILGGDRVDVTVEFERLRDDNGGPPLPERIAPTDVRIALLGPDGRTTFAVDQGLAEQPDAAPVDAKKLVRTIRDARVDPAWGQQGHIFLKLDADIPLEYRATPKVTLTPPCHRREDAFEPNDVVGSARTLEPGTHDARMCPGNSDWFALQVAGGDSVFVDLAVPPEKEGGRPFTIELLDPTGTVADRRTILPGGEDSVRGLDALIAGRWTWHIRSDEADAPYRMTVHRFGRCPEGNDAFEPNDELARTTRLPMDRGIVRHLRLCEGDVDYLRIDLPPAEEEGSGGSAAEEGSGDNSPKPFEILVSRLHVDPPVAASLRHPDDSIRAPGIPVVLLSEDPSAPPRTRGVVVATTPEPGEDHVVLRVDGPPGFYDVSLPNFVPPEPEPQDGEPQEGDESDASDENAQQQPSDDGTDGQPADQQESDGEENDQSDGREDGKGDEAPTPAEEEKGPDGEPTAGSEEERRKEAERRKVRALLDSLEPNDANLQLRQALEGQPMPRVRDEW